MERRTLLGGAAALAAGSLARAQDAPLRVGVIGHTGRGNYGHGLDKVWLQIPETKIVAVADADKNGLAGAQKRLGAENGFADYRKMLTETKPDIVAVCPRQPDQHAEMILASIAAGAAGIYVEKPFVRTLEEVDEIRKAAERSGTRIAVAHRNRYHPDLALIDRILRNEGPMRIGRLLEIRGRGKGDRRGGGEDLWVLGTHVLDLVTRFAGKPSGCSAVIREKGELVTPDHVREGNEALGLLAGDEIHARFSMESGITAYWDSLANEGTKNRSFGLQLIGSEGTVIVHCDATPLAHYREGNPLDPNNRAEWKPIGNTDRERIKQVGNHVYPCRDLLAAIREIRSPVCGLEEGAATVEMVMAVFQSHVEQGKIISIPLENRAHPFKNFKKFGDG